jgi:(p)ppGpp synthase/HD superfamily hydrolase
MSKKSDAPLMSPQFALALQFANQIHGTQSRKGAGIPYVSHLMSVSASVLEYGGSEAEAIAALLHDAAEDCGGRPMLDAVRTVFGDEVADIVSACTDTFDEPKPEWRPRKEAYVEHLGAASSSVKLVAGCDKLHNLSTTLKDLRRNPPADYWSRFTADGSEQAWYYGACAKALADSPVAEDFDRSYQELLDILTRRGDL